MILSQTAEYAIRAVTTIAMMPIGSTVSAIKVSELSKIPLPYLSKILRFLVEEKILKAQKGPGGGFKFHKPLDQITLISVLKAVNCNFDKSHCPFGWDRCSDKSPCPLHGTFSQLKNDCHSWASETTLEKIIADNLKLIKP